jgi:hypothetical protein
MNTHRTEQDSLGSVEVAADKLWGAQTQRSLEHFSIGHDLIPREMITAYAILKRSAAVANYAGGRLDDTVHRLILPPPSSRVQPPAPSASNSLFGGSIRLLAPLRAPLPAASSGACA